MRLDDTGWGKAARGLVRLLGRMVSANPDGAARQGNAPGRAMTNGHPSLLIKAQTALRQVEPMAVQGWGPAESIARQLRWCAAFAAGEPREARPGPFSMGLIATREFDMYGDRPELASLINEVQREAEALLARRP